MGKSAGPATQWLPESSQYIERGVVGVSSGKFWEPHLFK